MRKKILFQFITVIFTFCILSSSALASDGWADYYNNDRNFPMVWGHTNWATFIDRTSVAVERYDPPYYIIAINVFYVDNDGYGTIHEYATKRFYYNYDKTEMYIAQTPGKNDWIYIYPNDSVSAGQMDGKNVGEAAFYLAYHMKFYGAYRWKNTLVNGTEFESIFSNDFYAKL